jgi:hypothetical protein
MRTIITWISAHHTLAALVAFWLASNFVSSLPSPNSASGNAYKFLFTFTQGLAGSLPRLFPNLRLPVDPTRNDQTFFAPPKS